MISKEFLFHNFICQVISSKEYGRAVDWWGLGVVMYELLSGTIFIVIHLGLHKISISGHLPFYAEERKMMFWLILKEKTRYPRHISGESREIISKLLVKNPDRSVVCYPKPQSFKI